MNDTVNENKHSEQTNKDNLAEKPDTNDMLSDLLTDENLRDFLNLNTDDSRPGGSVPEQTEEIEKLEAELAELKDKHLRLIAEFDNFRRRQAKERIELGQTAGKEIISALLTVLDDMDRAGKQLETTTDVAAVKEGVGLVFSKMRGIMQQKGLKAMIVENATFDPELHEAITELPAPSEDMCGKVLHVVEPGYYLNEKLIRHAKVVVGK